MSDNNNTPTRLVDPTAFPIQWDLTTRMPIVPGSSHPAQPSADPTPTPTPTESTPVEPTDPTPEESRRDWVVDLGLTAAGLAAIAASYSALKGLANLTGWGRLDWLLWVAIDIYALTATRVWLSKRTRSRKVRRFAANNSLGAIFLSLAGNAAYHAIHANAWNLGNRFWMLVVAVSSVPPIIIGLIGHLAVLRTRDADFAAEESTATTVDPTSTATDSIRPDSSSIRVDPIARTRESTPDPDPTEEESTDSTRPDPSRVDPDQTPDPTQEPDPEPTRRPDPNSQRPNPESEKPTGESTEDELLDRARELNAAHIARHGRPIGAESIRTELKVGSARARTLRDAVRNLRVVSPDPKATGEEKTG